MNLSGCVRLWIAASAVAVSTACQEEMITLESDDEAGPMLEADPTCVLDIRVAGDGAVFWKGEKISDAEFDRRLRDGRTGEACIPPKNSPPESR